MNALAQAGAALLGGTILRAEVLGGGDLSQIVRIELADGREAIVKNGPSPRTEAAMLKAIAASGAPAPAVLGANDEALALELLPTEGSLHNAWASLGKALATLHRATGERYGWPDDYAFGRLAIPNGWADDWPRFWAERRLLIHLAHLPPSLARRIEQLSADLPSRLPARPRPALLHGDMWGGNVLVAGHRVSGLIDPACYYGHSEVDLGMLTLFDRPGAAFYDAYSPLEPGHEERLVIYRLWPALVHLRLFGSGYRSMVERFLTDTGV
jgi:fructosamine-3-kinase